MLRLPYLCLCFCATLVAQCLCILLMLAVHLMEVWVCAHRAANLQSNFDGRICNPHTADSVINTLFLCAALSVLQFLLLAIAQITSQSRDEPDLHYE